MLYHSIAYYIMVLYLDPTNRDISYREPFGEQHNKSHCSHFYENPDLFPRRYVMYGYYYHLNNLHFMISHNINDVSAAHVFSQHHDRNTQHHDPAPGAGEASG